MFLCGRERVQPRRDDGLDAVRNRDLGKGDGQCPEIVLERQDPALDKSAEHLLQEQRVAAGPFEYEVDQRGRRRPVLKNSPDQVPALFDPKRVQKENCGTGLAAHPSLAAVQQFGSRQDEQHQRDLADEVRCVFEEVERYVFGRMEILENKHERRPRGHRLEERAHPSEERLARHFLPFSAQPQHNMQGRRGAADVQPHRGGLDLLACHLQRVVEKDSALFADRLTKRPERYARAVGNRAAAEGVHIFIA